ncbi:HNH endonuclease [Streptomyces sp. NBC_00237]|uniref:HNH endonuclease signature motif containing protein n=1 Tax=Streptomyces sp. NBC_00237 TaxID=2975687 RepID=UPI00224E46A5|nr:HNH endonuclease signature motif containing protein [Streptomyces sp. NBC_00237]MCX5204584.1 HNH endonuclease [Streptomyces sp. NBC_00237]
MALNEIGRSQVLGAVAEFDRVGREEFLRRYGFQAARTYLLAVKGRYYDSKAIVGAAHGLLPGRQALAASEFSGGQSHAVKLLSGLGFQVVYTSELSRSIGADELVQRVEKLRVAHAQGQKGAPLLYQPITLLWAVGRALRGESRTLPWAETDDALRGLLSRHGLRGEGPRPYYPVLALYHSGLWTLEGHTGVVPAASGGSELGRWCARQQPVSGLAGPAYELMRRDGRARLLVVDALVSRFFDGLDEIPLLKEVGLYDDTVADDAPDAPADALPRASRAVDPLALAAEYERQCILAEHREKSVRGLRREGTSRDPIRIAAARRAVLWRSGGRCENPGCGGQPDDVTDRGLPLLEVDHVEEIAGGGRDHPSQMIALCPNCHAVKTRGSRREELRKVFREVARKEHLRLLPEEGRARQPSSRVVIP